MKQEEKQRKGKETNRYKPPGQCPPAPESASVTAPYCHSFGRELPDFSCCQEVHHCLVAHFHGKLLRDPQVLASACSPFRRFSHRLLLCFLLVSPLAAVAEEVLLGLGPILHPLQCHKHLSSSQWVNCCT